MLTLIYFIIIVCCWTMNPFLKKLILTKNKITTDEYFVINHFIITMLLFAYFIYLFRSSKCSVNCVKKLEVRDGILILITALTSIIAARLLLNIIKTRDISYMVANLQPLVILSTFIIGYVFFMEKVNNYRIAGGIFVILGIILLNKK